MACTALHTPFGFVQIAPRLIFSEDLHAPLTRAITVLFPNPSYGTAVPRTSDKKIMSCRIQESHQRTATWHDVRRPWQKDGLKYTPHT